MPISRIQVFVARVIFVCVAAGVLTYFVSLLAGVDFKEDSILLDKLNRLSSKISYELDRGINKRVMELGLAPAREPQRESYCNRLAKELNELYYLAAKPGIALGLYDEMEYRQKTTHILTLANNSDLTSLLNEIIPLTRELQHSLDLIEDTKRDIAKRRIAYVLLYFALAIVLYIIVFYRNKIRGYFMDRRMRLGYDRRSGEDRRKRHNPAYHLYHKERRKKGERRKEDGDRRERT